MSDIRVEVCHALPDRQWLVTIELPAGSTLAEALHRCELLQELPGIDMQCLAVGLFGDRASLDTVLHDGDRVEIYRPLLADPKEIRRRRALRMRRTRRHSPG